MRLSCALRAVSLLSLLLGLPAAGRGAPNRDAPASAASEDGYDYENGDSNFKKPSYIDGWGGAKKKLVYTREEGLTFFGTDGKGRWMYPGAGARKCAQGGLPPQEGRMRVWFPGIRSAVLVQNTSSGRTYNYLIDPGRSENAKDIVDFLRMLHVSTLDSVILTHAHGDHYAATQAVLDAFEVKALYHPGWTPSCANRIDRFEQLLRYAQQDKGVPVSVLTEDGAGERKLQWPGLEVEVLGPPPGYLTPAGWKCSPKDDLLNANSIVLRVADGERTALLTGDITVAAMEYQLKEHRKRLKADVLLAPHHGINYLKRFEDAVDAWRTVINWDHKMRSSPESLQQLAGDN